MGNGGLPPLRGVRVLQVGALEAAQYAVRLLVNFGASATLVEPLAGDYLRDIGPFWRREGERVSLPFEYLNGGKRSIALDFSTEFGRDALARTVANSEILVTSAADLPTVVEATRTRRDDGAVPVVASYGPEGGQVPLPSTELTRYNGGASAQLVPLPSPEWRPVLPGRHSFELMAGTGVAVAILAAFWELNRAGPSTADVPFVFVDFSHLAYGVWLEKGVLHRTQRNPIKLRPYTNGYSYGGNLRCKDGRYVCLFSLEEHHWQRLATLIGKEEWLEDERFRDGVQRLANGETINDALRAWCSSHDAHDIITACREADVVVGEVLTPADVISRDVYWERGFFRGNPAGNGDAGLAIGLPTGPGLPQQAVGAAPHLGQHTQEILEELGYGTETIEALELLGVVH